MALIDILNNLAREVGLNLADSNVKDIWISKVNDSAKDIYDLYDLPGCLREQVFDVDITSRQMVLPYYVDKIRGVRSYSTLSRIKQLDMRPRYFYGEWTQPFLSWRNKGFSPLCHDLVQDSRLLVTMPFPVLEDFKVYIEGSTSTADRLVEELLFPPGTLSVQSVNQFTNNAPSQSPQGIRSIRKDKPISSNIQVFDVNNLLVSEIANEELQASYTLLQVTDLDQPLNSPCDCYEILYKFRFTPFKADFSTFPIVGADDAVFWKTLSRYYALKKDNDSTKLALGFDDKCNGELRKLTKSDEDSDEKQIQFQPNQYLDVICPFSNTFLLP